MLQEPPQVPGEAASVSVAWGKANSLAWHAGDMAGNGEAGGPGPCEEHWHLQFQRQEDPGKVPLWILNCRESKPPLMCKLLCLSGSIPCALITYCQELSGGFRDDLMPFRADPMSANEDGHCLGRG